MALFFSVTLAISIVGILTLIVLKRREVNTGKIILRDARPAIGEFFHRILSFFESVAPRALQRLLARGYWALRRLAQRALAWGLLLIERLLEKSLEMLRGPQRTSNTKEATGFLREVTEHKKMLQKEGEQAIYEE